MMLSATSSNVQWTSRVLQIWRGILPKFLILLVPSLLLANSAFTKESAVPYPPFRPNIASDAPVPEFRPEQSVSTEDGVSDEAVEPQAADVESPGEETVAMAIPVFRPSDPPPPTRIVAPDDYYAVQKFIALLEEEAILAALSVQATILDPLARELTEWLYVRSAAIHATPDRIGEFIATHQDWPDLTLIKVRQEGAFYIQNVTPEKIDEIYGDDQPISGVGKIVLARWHVAEGNTETAAELIKQVWHMATLSRAQEDQVLSEFSDFLDATDHRIRARRLYYEGRSSDAARIARMSGRFGTQLVRAYGAVGKRTRSARNIMSNLPIGVRSDPIIVLREAQAQRRRSNPVAAAEIILDATPDNQHLTDARGWWPERRLLVRLVLLEGRPDLAFRLAAGHNNPPGLYFAQAEFLAGWVALRHQYNPELALAHFSRLRGGVTRPLSISRAEYWLGRTQQVLGDLPAAAMHFANAAAYQHTYYGQLAALEAGQINIDLGSETEPGPADRETFESGDVARAATLLADLGEYSLMQKFLVQIGTTSSFDPEIILAARFAQGNGRADIALRVGKAALNRGRDHFPSAFTLAGLPEGFEDNHSLEPALVYAVSRQESAFLQTAVSRSGARGLLQLMPATAREVATDLQLPYNLARLTQDPSYNVILGATYLEGLLERFTGSYILTIAGYNAGGGRVTQWIESFGDPRDENIDPIDWIEMIPFNETRNYVQRVLANLQVYRARLNNNRQVLDLENDLARNAN
jgi:peptidoglycan lytic transglycosylase